MIVHVRDVSHPDRDAQKRNVLETLCRLRLPQQLQRSVVEVANKVDRLSRYAVCACVRAFDVSRCRRDRPASDLTCSTPLVCDFETLFLYFETKRAVDFNCLIF